MSILSLGCLLNIFKIQVKNITGIHKQYLFNYILKPLVTFIVIN